MRVSVTLESNGSISTFEVEADSPMENLSLLIEVELGVPTSEQVLFLDGNYLSQQALAMTVGECGLKDGDMVLVRSRLNVSRGLGAPTRSTVERRMDIFEQQAMELINGAQGNPAIMQRLEHHPEMHRAVVNQDVETVARLARELHEQRERQREAHSRDEQILMSDPFSAEAQRIIEQRIQNENIASNLEAGLEHNPEAFGAVIMLFIPAKINGQQVLAFVDSGAQSTIISKDCAERVGILRLLDTRFQGIAKGVGTAKILGRVHLALLSVGDQVLECTFTVLESFGYDILLGLDMMRKYQVILDLKDNCLRIHEAVIPFLAEKDVPRRFLGGQVGPPSSSEAREAPDLDRVSQPSSNPNLGDQTVQDVSTPSGPSREVRNLTNKVRRLMELGFSSDEANDALENTQGNEEAAASWLVNRKYGF